MHALEASWRRLVLLQEAVLGQGAVLTEAQLAKERELLVDIRGRLHQAKVRRRGGGTWVWSCGESFCSGCVSMHLRMREAGYGQAGWLHEGHDVCGNKHG